MENHPELGFGIMRMPQKNGAVDWMKSKQLIDEYMKGDYCYFDTHPFYMMGQSQRIIKEYVVKRYDRNHFLLANKMPYGEKAGYRDYIKIFEEELVACGVEFFDYYLLHAISRDVYKMHEKLGGFNFLREIKEKGFVRKIGFSFHDSYELLDEILDKHPETDFVQLQINYLDWENPLIQSKACYEVAQKHGKPILVMEPIKGGRLAPEENSSEYAKKALQFVKALPGIQVILSGMSEISHIIENRNTLAEIERQNADDLFIYERMRQKIENKNPIPCTECGYCIRECPKGVRVPEIFSLVNTYGKMYERIRVSYKDRILGKGGAEECMNCGRCERYCPQKIEIRKHLRRVVQLGKKNFFYTAERNVQILISLLREYGIKKIIASPGASNAEFVYSIQQDDFFEIFSAPDERSAAYIACGLAEESGVPVVISCTGATASRNYLPGLTEAYYRHIPVIAVTSAQANARIGHNIPQVIDRRRHSDDIVKMSVELPSVKDEEDEWNCIINANMVLNQLWHRDTGPVHINLITRGCQDFSVKKLPHVRVIRRIQEKGIFPKVPDGKLGIFCGAHKIWSAELVSSVDSFCEKYGGVVICDHTSNYFGRFRWTVLPLGRESRESLLSDIDLLIHIGDVSGAYFPIRAKEVWRVHPNGEYCDTYRSLSNVFEMNEQEFFERYVSFYQEENKRKTRKWQFTENTSVNFSDMPFSNAWIAFQTAPKIPENAVLHLGILNSLRTWNFFQVPKSVRVYSNTGGFGIDGCVSTLIGAALADPKKLYFGVVGDLAFFYDMNVLGNRHVGNNVRLLVVNNGGGTEFKNYNHAARIFEEDTDLFIAAKGHYGSQSRRLLKDYVENLGFCYRTASSKDEYQQILPEFVDAEKKDSSLILEVFTDSEAESEALRMLNEDVTDKSDTGNVTKLVEARVPKWLQTLHEKEVVLWGCGYVFSRDLSKVEQYVGIQYVCDSNPEKWNREVVPGILCISPSELQKKKDVFVVIMLEDAKIGFEIAHQLQELGIRYFDMVEKWLTYASQMKWKEI